MNPFDEYEKIMLGIDRTTVSFAEALRLKPFESYNDTVVVPDVHQHIFERLFSEIENDSSVIGCIREIRSILDRINPILHRQILVGEGKYSKVYALSKTEVVKVKKEEVSRASSLWRSKNYVECSVNDEQRVLKAANAVNGLYVKFVRKAIIENNFASVLERLYPIDPSSLNTEVLFEYFDRFEQQLLELHDKGVAHGDLNLKTRIIKTGSPHPTGTFYPNVIFTSMGIRLIDAGWSKLRDECEEHVFSTAVERDLEGLKYWRNRLLGNYNDWLNDAPLLNGKKVSGWEVVEFLRKDGFSNCYIARDLALDRLLYVRECFPDFFVRRRNDGKVFPVVGKRPDFEWALRRFREVARKFAKLSHPNLQSIGAFIETNGTSYIVSRYLEGSSLENRLCKRKGCPAEPEIRSWLLPMLGAVEFLHKKGLVHRGICSDEIFITNDGTPILMGLGEIPNGYIDREATLSQIMKPGYSPLEQYYEEGTIGPWTDIYAISATLYRALASTPPPDAIQRVREDPYVSISEIVNCDDYSGALLNTIDQGLKVDEKERPQSIKEFRDLLEL